jgi:hypothetical protein
MSIDIIIMLATVCSMNSAAGQASTMTRAQSSVNPRSPSPVGIRSLVDVESVPLDPVPPDCLSRAEKWIPVRRIFRFTFSGSLTW